MRKLIDHKHAQGRTVTHWYYDDNDVIVLHFDNDESLVLYHDEMELREYLDQRRMCYEFDSPRYGLATQPEIDEERERRIDEENEDRKESQRRQLEALLRLKERGEI